MSDTAHRDVPVLLVDGREYGGWLSLKVTRAIDQIASTFEVEVSERWVTQNDPWPIVPFTPVVARLGADVVLTGYADVLSAAYDAQRHTVTISGRSKVADLVDCTPAGRGTEYRGSTVEAIARALAAPYGIEVKAEVETGGAVPLHAGDPTETVSQIIASLAERRGLLLTDDATGALVITRASTERDDAPLIEGKTILAAKAELNGAARYSDYRVVGQSGQASAWVGSGAGTDGDRTVAEAARAQPSISGTARDPDVPRFRLRTLRADGPSSTATARERVLWAAASARAKALTVRVQVQGWRKPDGALWRPNRLVRVTSPRLHVDQDLLVAKVSWGLDPRRGRTTDLELGPREAWIAEPQGSRGATAAGRSGGSGEPWGVQPAI